MNNDVNRSLPQIPYAEIMAYPAVAAVDACGLRCPLPLLRAKQALRDLGSGEALRVIATDSGSVRDFLSFAELGGPELDGFCEAEGKYIYLLRKK